MRRATLLAAVWVLVGTGAARANFIVNGGFETGNFSGWTHTSNVGDDVTTSSLIVHSGMYGAVLSPRPGGSGNSLSQTVTGLTVGDTYTLSFWLRNLNNGGTLFNVKVGTAPFVGQNVLVNQSFTNSPAFPYTKFSYDFTATNTSTTVLFGYIGGASQWGLDDVSLEPVSATPAPPTAVCLLLGVATLGLVWRARPSTLAG